MVVAMMSHYVRMLDHWRYCSNDRAGDAVRTTWDLIGGSCRGSLCK